MRVILGAWMLDMNTTNFHADLNLEKTINELVTVPAGTDMYYAKIKNRFLE